MGVKNQIGKLIDKFYIENIKSVVFIDDDFFTLETLLNDRMNDISKEDLSNPVEDPDASPFKSAGHEDTFSEEQEDCSTSKEGEASYKCKARVYHLVSSAHNKGLLVDILNDYPSQNDFWKRADLLILDYLIDESPNKTLATLEHLANESDYNLVVVYTNESEGAAENVSKLLKCYLDTAPVAERKDDEGVYHKQVDLTDHPWIACRNLFVVFVPKGQEEEFADIDNLIEALKNALKQYNPSPMEVLGRVVAMDLSRYIHTNIHKMLPTREDKAAALFAAIHDMKDTNSSEEKRLALNKLLTVLFRKADSVLSSSATDELSQLISDVRKVSLQGEGFRLVCKLEKAFESKLYPNDYYSYLNKFICNDPNIPTKLTTGTIFFIKDDKGEYVYYVCVSPECDLARGKIKKILGVKINVCDAIANKLKEVHKNKYILFSNEHDTKMGSVDPLNIHIDNFFLCETDPPEYYAIKEESTSQQEEDEKHFCMTFKKIPIHIVAQLRSEYAHRLMALTGAWHGRIGLDFISIPKE